MTKYKPPPAFEQSLLIKRGKRAAPERASEQHSRFRVSSRVPLARLLFTISPKWKAYSQANPVQNLQTRFLYTFSRFSICCSVKSSDEEDLWSKKSSKFKNFDPTKHFTFVNFMFSTYNFIILQQF